MKACFRVTETSFILTGMLLTQVHSFSQNSTNYIESMCFITCKLYHNLQKAYGEKQNIVKHLCWDLRKMFSYFKVHMDLLECLL